MDNAAMTLAVTDNDNLIPLGRGGAFSPWMTPHVYENRHGLNSEKFRDSPASGDWWGHYSIKVDKDIYVYSIGGELYSQRLHWAWWTYHGPRIAGAAMLIAAIAILIVRVKRGAAKMVLGMVALTASVGAGTAVTFVGHVLCYAMMPAFSRRDPEMIDRQRALLTTYRQRGVLGEAAYKTALEALENGPATTRPAGAASQKHK
ncbi:MAG: hypothetical protein LLG03_05305 [Planctomycetaceae bacterium]|nr:hypothetical protein [Planctomycetaceae bacterium]